jgi:hypothetical protein
MGIGDATFDVLLPVSGDAACVAHLVGDEGEFRGRLAELMQSPSESDAATLAAPIPPGVSDPYLELLRAALNRVGGAVVQAVEPV